MPQKPSSIATAKRRFLRYQWPKSFMVIGLLLLSFLSGFYIWMGKPVPLYFAQNQKQHIQIHTSKERFVFNTEIVTTPEAMQKGLMYRQNLPENEAMLFLYPQEKMRYMWMKNTYIPLDMLFVGEDKRIGYIHHRAEPLSEEIISSKQPAIAVVEILGGRAKQLQIQIGDKVTW